MAKFDKGALDRTALASLHAAIVEARKGFDKCCDEGYHSRIASYAIQNIEALEFEVKNLQKGKSQTRSTEQWIAEVGILEGLAIAIAFTDDPEGSGESALVDAVRDVAQELETAITD